MTVIPNSGNKSSPSPATIKFLYSYGGKILPRKTDGKLRYVGGHTRVLSADRSVTYAELIVKFWEACGFSVNLKCKLPSEDLDVLVSVTSDEDLAAVVEEYDRCSPDAKVRAVLCPVNSLKTISPVPSVESLVDYSVSGRLPYSRTQPQRKPHGIGYSAYDSGKFRRNIVDGSCRDKPLLVPRSSRDSIPMNFFVHHNNVQGLNSKRFGVR